MHMVSSLGEDSSSPQWHADNLRPLSRSFFARDAAIVAKGVVGKLLVRRLDRELLVARIVETEAYMGEHDPAAHASFGRTARTEALYGPPGHAYVYRIHGHTCLNFVAEERDTPGCVLIRAVEPLQGRATMTILRGRTDLPETQLANGPGKLCKAMGIDMSMYGIDLVDSNAPLYVCAPPHADPFKIGVGPRIGITKATDWELRFTLLGSPYISRR